MAKAWEVFVGVVLAIAGSCLFIALLAIIPSRGDSAFDFIGKITIIEAYSLISTLFLLLGLRYMFGTRPLIQRLIGSTRRRLLATSIVISLLIGIVAGYVTS